MMRMAADRRPSRHNLEGRLGAHFGGDGGAEASVRRGGAQAGDDDGGERDGETADSEEAESHVVNSARTKALCFRVREASDAEARDDDA